MNEQRTTRRPWVDAAIVIALLLLAVAVRWPLFLNATAMMDSDESFNALAMKHLVHGDAFFLYYPGQSYQGITEGLVGIALTHLLGWSALSYKLASFVFYLLFLVGLYAMTREVLGRSAAAMALLFGAVGAPQTLVYSLLARGGHMAVVAFGAWMLFFVFRFERTGRSPWLCALCLTAALSYYTYRLSIVFLVPLAAYAVFRLRLIPMLRRAAWSADTSASLARRRLLRGLDMTILLFLLVFVVALVTGDIRWHLGPITIAAKSSWNTFRWVLLLTAVRISASWAEIRPLFVQRRRLWLGAGMALLIGSSPLWLAQVIAPPEKAFSYNVGDIDHSNSAKMLWEDTLPSILGYMHPADLSEAGVAFWKQGCFWLLLLFGAVFVWAVIRVVRTDGLNLLCLLGKPARPETLWLGVGLAVLGAYCASSFIVDTTSSRYLLPLLAVFPALLASAFQDWGFRLRRHLRVPGTAWLLAIAVSAIQIRQDFVDCRTRGFIAPDRWVPVRQRGMSESVVAFLRGRNIHTGYGNYWISYVVTFLTNEGIVMTPYHHVNERRPPNYLAQVRKDPNPAYVFIEGLDWEPMHAFESEVERRGLPSDCELFSDDRARVRVYYSKSGTFPHDL